MSDWPITSVPPSVFISPYSELALGTEMGALAAAAPASVAWATANLARYYPFVLPEPMLVRKLWIYKGATVTGNVDVGIYTEDGTRIVSSGSTAVAATGSILQEFDITDTQIGRGRYYMAAAMSLTTTTMFANALVVSQAKLLGWLEQASALPLPATATFAVAASAVQPVFGLSGRTQVL